LTVLSPDGRAMATTSFAHGAVQLVDTESRKELRQFPVRGQVDRVAFSPDGTVLAATAADRLYRWETTSGKEFPPIAISAGKGLVFSPNGKTLAWSENQVLHLAEVRTGTKLRQSQHHGNPIEVIAFGGDGETLVAADGEKITQWSPFGGKLRELTAPERFGSCLALSNDGRMLAAGEKTGVLAVFEVATGRLRRRFEGHRNAVRAAVYSPGGRFLYSAGLDRTALAWDLYAETAEDKAPPASGLLSSHLAVEEGAVAYRAMRFLLRDPRSLLTMVNENLAAINTPREDPRLGRLIADLDADVFAVREQAMQELGKLGIHSKAALERTLESQ